jgi:hypothetical protein
MNTSGGSSGDMNHFAYLVRAWVHQNGLVESFNKQASNARKIRDNYEQEIINDLVKKNMSNAVIKINGGKLKVVDDKHPMCLTLTRIEELINDYYVHRGYKINETKNIMDHIRSKRGFEIHKKLKSIPDAGQTNASIANMQQQQFLMSNSNNVQGIIKKQITDSGFESQELK